MDCHPDFVQTGCPGPQCLADGFEYRISQVFHEVETLLAAELAYSFGSLQIAHRIGQLVSGHALRGSAKKESQAKADGLGVVLFLFATAEMHPQTKVGKCQGRAGRRKQAVCEGKTPDKKQESMGLQGPSMQGYSRLDGLSRTAREGEM